MDIEFHQLDLRYARLRSQRPSTEKQLLASLAEIGQQIPVVVVRAEDERFVLIDGHKRVRALRRLGHDTVRATRWDLSEPDALLMDRLMRTGDSASPLEQGWLLHELAVRFDLSLEELGRRFSRSPSWVSRRLALVEDLPAEIQEHVRRGELPAHAAMKHLVPLARANADDCRRLVEGIAGKGLSNRQVGALYAAWRDGIAGTRERVLEAPMLFLKARDQIVGPPKDEGRALFDDLDMLTAIARRARRRLRAGVFRRLLPPERSEVSRCMRSARGELDRLGRRMNEEERNARPGITSGDLRAVPEGE